MRKINILAIVLLSLFGARLSFAQADAPAKRPCELPEGKQFDFWVGEWDLSWPAGQGGPGEDQPGKGTNSVKKILGDCVVQENFAKSATSYKGMSVSAYKPKLGAWQQTWVDTDGNYLLFTGHFKDGVMELHSPKRKMPDGKILSFRMIFKNISADSFDWSYQASKDDEKTWKDNWNIHYQRKK